MSKTNKKPGCTGLVPGGAAPLMVPTKTKTSPKRTITKSAIDEHPILGRHFAIEWRELAHTFSKVAGRKGERYTLMDHARIVLRAAGRNYAEASDESVPSYHHVKRDLELQRAAILYAYEALRNTTEPIIAECMDRNAALDLLQDLVDVLTELQ